MEHEDDEVVEPVEGKEAFEKIAEKRAPSDVVLMQWCPTMDLVIIVTNFNQLVLYRLSWQKVWSVAPQDQQITSVTWRPDGKVIAVGQSDGVIFLIDVEHGHELHRHTVESGVCSMTWSIHVKDEVTDDLLPHINYRDRASEILPPLPSLGDSNSTGRIGETEEVDVLAVAAENATINLFALGILNIGKIDLQKECRIAQCRVLSIKMEFSHSLETLTIAFLNDTDNLMATVFRIPFLTENLSEVHVLAMQCAQMNSLTKYLSAVIKEMHSSWESILIELDAKLAAYSSGLEEEDESAESLEHQFMALLIRGVPSVELEAFLARELSARKLKALGAALEASYSSIQKLALDHLNQVIQILMFRLGDLSGFAEWEERFEALGLQKDLVAACNTVLGSLALKSSELVRVIGNSTLNYKAFFAWLQRVVSTLGDNADTMTSMPKVDFHQVATFIEENFGHAGPNKKFSVEHVGQYFESVPLRKLQAHPQRGWLFHLKELTLDAPEDGLHGELFCLIEESVSDPTQITKLFLENHFQGRANERKLDAALAWLIDEEYITLSDSYDGGSGSGIGGGGGGWYTLANASVTASTSHPLLYPDRVGESLMQIFEDLENRISTIFTTPGIVCSNAIVCLGTTCIVGGAREISTSGFTVQRWPQAENGNFSTMIAVASSADGFTDLHIVAIAPTKGCAFELGSMGIDFGALRIEQMQRYSDTSVVILSSAGSDHTIALVQGDTERLKPSISSEEYVEGVAMQTLSTPLNEFAIQRRGLEGITPSHIFVSATRKLASVLSENMRTVFLYDLAAEEDDEEEEDEDEDEDEDDVEDGQGDEVEDDDADTPSPTKLAKLHDDAVEDDDDVDE